MKRKNCLFRSFGGKIAELSSFVSWNWTQVWRDGEWSWDSLTHSNSNSNSDPDRNWASKMLKSTKGGGNYCFCLTYGNYLLIYNRVYSVRQSYSIGRPNFECFKATKLSSWPKISYSQRFEQIMQLLLLQHYSKLHSNPWIEIRMTNPAFVFLLHSFRLGSQNTSGQSCRTYLGFQLPKAPLLARILSVSPGTTLLWLAQSDVSIAEMRVYSNLLVTSVCFRCFKFYLDWEFCGFKLCNWIWPLAAPQSSPRASQLATRSP